MKMSKEKRALIAGMIGCLLYVIGDTADGREALAMVEAQHPAVLVLDTVLPGLDGTGILRRLKGKSETRCIVVTEFRTAEAARDIRDAGAYVFPVSYTHLWAAAATITTYPRKMP